MGNAMIWSLGHGLQELQKEQKSGGLAKISSREESLGCRMCSGRTRVPLLPTSLVSFLDLWKFSAFYRFGLDFDFDFDFGDDV